MTVIAVVSAVALVFLVFFLRLLQQAALHDTERLRSLREKTGAGQSRAGVSLTEEPEEAATAQEETGPGETPKPA